MSVDMTTPAAPGTIRSQVAGAIQQAASATGTSFEYLVAAAKIESNLDPNAAASTSSAKGLYQFIDQTWLGTVKQAGASFGYGQYADAITQLPSGNYTVNDPKLRDAILKLRHDPAANAAMAGVLTQSNSFKMTGAIGRRPTDGELYIAHFLGAGGASKLVVQAENNPQSNAAQMFPNAAAANPSIFYDRAGAPRSVSQVYGVLTGRYAAAANSPGSRNMIAAAGGVVPTSAPVQNSAYLAAFPQMAASQSSTVSSVTAPQASTATGATRPAFRSLFQPGDRDGPISNTVQELWATGRRDALTEVASASPASANSPSLLPAAAPTLKPPSPLDLFSDRTGAFSS